MEDLIVTRKELQTQLQQVEEKLAKERAVKERAHLEALSADAGTQAARELRPFLDRYEWLEHQSSWCDNRIPAWHMLRMKAWAKHVRAHCKHPLRIQKSRQDDESRYCYYACTTCGKDLGEASGSCSFGRHM